MNTSVTRNLNPEKALIFRITHRNNIPWILDHGLCCSNHNDHDPDFVPIGHPEVISRRQHRTVPLAPGGYAGRLYSVLLHALLAHDVQHPYRSRSSQTRQRRNSRTGLLVTPHHQGRSLICLYRPACLSETANYYNNINDLKNIDFELLQSRNFKRDPENPEPFDRYQAEALIHHRLPAQTLLGIVCYTETLAAGIQAELQARNMTIKTIAQPSWYFQ